MVRRTPPSPFRAALSPMYRFVSHQINSAYMDALVYFVAHILRLAKYRYASFIPHNGVDVSQLVR
jgi:hypothetical protein